MRCRPVLHVTYRRTASSALNQTALQDSRPPWLAARLGGGGFIGCDVIKPRPLPASFGHYAPRAHNNFADATAAATGSKGTLTLLAIDQSAPQVDRVGWRCCDWGRWWNPVWAVDCGSSAPRIGNCYLEISKSTRLWPSETIETVSLQCQPL
ncbi:hypothetical protein BX600DRAFT_275104 [Xylariales sp. PMI_506]|nr:hypothetical protein BX600DRAFT_275104 [Xylariales sp. PMI_506]